MKRVRAPCSSSWQRDMAAEQFREANDRWPAALGELVPEHRSAVPRDPYDRQPLWLARRP